MYYPFEKSAGLDVVRVPYLDFVRVIHLYVPLTHVRTNQV